MAALASNTIRQNHYLHSMPDDRTSWEAFCIGFKQWMVGFLIFDRPEAPRCGNWYGKLDDMRNGSCEVTNWQILNLARVWINPDFQHGGLSYRPDILPGFVDRKGQFRSTLASDILRAAMQIIGFEYIKVRRPCYLEEPYQIDWLLSYCDITLHKGTIYAASGFELYSTNAEGKQTWRHRLPPLTDEQHAVIHRLSLQDSRSQRYRNQRAEKATQLELLL